MLSSVATLRIAGCTYFIVEGKGLVSTIRKLTYFRLHESPNLLVSALGFKAQGEESDADSQVWTKAEEHSIELCNRPRKAGFNVFCFNFHWLYLSKALPEGPGVSGILNPDC